MNAARRLARPVAAKVGCAELPRSTPAEPKAEHARPVTTCALIPATQAAPAVVEPALHVTRDNVAPRAFANATRRDAARAVVDPTDARLPLSLPAGPRAIRVKCATQPSPTRAPTALAPVELAQPASQDSDAWQEAACAIRLHVRLGAATHKNCALPEAKNQNVEISATHASLACNRRNATPSHVRVSDTFHGRR